MPKVKPANEGPDLLDLLDEIEQGPPPCLHHHNPRNGGGWVHETDPDSPYFLEWVHSDPRCRRSALPGLHKTPMPTRGWSRKKQKDVKLDGTTGSKSSKKSKAKGKKKRHANA